MIRFLLLCLVFPFCFFYDLQVAVLVNYDLLVYSSDSECLLL